MDEKEINLPDETPREETLPAEKETTFLGDPVRQSAPPARSKTPLRRLRPLLILFGVAVVLTASVFVLRYVLPKDAAKDPDDKKDSIQLLDLVGSSADRMEIKNDNDQYAFVKKVEKTFLIEGKEDCPVSNSTILAALTTFGTLTAKTEVEGGIEHLEEYGLNDPIATVTWQKGAESHRMELGTASPTGGYYMRLDGGDTVYTYAAENANYFLSKRMDYYDTSVYDFDQNQDAEYINRFAIRQKDGESIEVLLQDLSEDSLDSAYLMVEPIRHNFSLEKSDAIVNLIGNLTVCTVYDDSLAPETLSKYGLDDPDYTFEFVNVQEEHILKFGKLSDEGYRYMCTNGSPFVYIVDDDTINLLMHDVAYYCEKISYTRSYDTIDKLVISGGGKRYEIDITGTAADDDLKAYINNKYVDYDRFADLYAHIISIEIKEVGQKAPEDSLAVTVEIDCLDGSKDVLRYYRKNDIDSFFELNGEGRLIVATSKVEQILQFAQQLYDGKEIILDW